MNTQFEQKLIDAMDALEQGETIDDVLARYPEDAAALRPMLETAVALADLNVQPSLAAQARSRNAFLAEAAALKAGGATRMSWLQGLRRLLTPALALAAVLIFFSAGLVNASASALPGDALYGAKLFVEDVRLALTTDIEARESLSAQFQAERLAEIQTLLNRDREADVVFTGVVERMRGTVWQIGGIATTVTADTVIDGQLQVGAEVVVNGRVQNNVLTANTITVLSSAPPPEPTATPTPQPTGTPQPSATPAAITPSPTPTLEPPATATTAPEAPPTATAVPAANDNSDDDDGQNGGDDDNDNDNDDDDSGNNGNGNNNGGDDDDDNDDDDNDNDNDDDDSGNNGNGNNNGGDDDDDNDNDDDDDA